MNQESLQGNKSQQYSTIQSVSLKSRLYKNLATEPKDRYEHFEKKLLQPTSITPNFVLSQRLIPKIALRSRLEPIMLESQKSPLGVTISQGRILIDRGDHSSRVHLSQFHSHSNLQDLIQEQYQPKSVIILSDQQTMASKVKSLAPLGNKFSQNGTMNNEESIIGHNHYHSTQGDESSIVGMLGHNESVQQIIQASTLKKKIKDKKDVGAKRTKKGGITRSSVALIPESKDYLTPMDFIHLIRTDPEMIDEFCYLNKQSHPYDFKIVEFDERNPREYMTISARGITHFLDEEASFLNIEEWEREARMFTRLKNIEFFRKYKLWKNYFLWKRLMRKNIMLQNQKIMNLHLFTVDRQLRMTLLEVRRLCQNMSSEIRFLDTTLQEPQRHEDFKITQDKYRMSYMDVKFDTYELQIKDIVISSCQKSLYTFKEENRIPLREDNEDDTEERAPLLVGDESGKEMPYTQEATIRTHYKKLKKFVKLMDYLVVDSKLQMMSNSAEQIVQQVQDMNAAYSETKGQTKKQMFRTNSQSWVIMEGINKADVIVFNPAREGLRKLFEDIITKGVSRICTKHRELTTTLELQQYIQSENDDQAAQVDAFDLKGLIYSNELFLGAQLHLRREVDQSFDYVEEYADTLQPYVQWFMENTSTNIVQAFRDKDIEDFKNAVVAYRTQDGAFQAMEPSLEIGMVLFDNQKLKERIKGSAQVCQEELFKFMPELNYQKAVEFVQAAHLLHTQISVLPTTVDQFVIYMDNVNTVNQHLDSLGTTSGEITAMALLIEELRIKVSEKYKQKYQDVNVQVGTLRKKVDDAMASYDQNLNRFRKDMEKMVPSIDVKIKELQERLEDQPIGSVSADLPKMINFIHDLRAELDQVQEQSKKLNQYQIALQMEYTQFEKLGAFQTEFGIYEKLWGGRQEWISAYSSWQTQQINAVDMEDMNNVIERLQKAANLCVKELEMNDMAKLFKSDIEAYKGVVYVLTSLRDQSLKEREWDEIRALITASVESGVLRTKIKDPFADLNDPQYCVQWIEQNRIVEVKDKLGEIALKASKEVELVRMIENVEAVWRSTSLVVVSYKDNKEVSILGNNEDVIAKIDDTLLTVNNILASRFVEGIRARVELQQKQLRYFQELVDEWILHQRNWLYLEPILISPYSAKNLVKETKIFQQADSQWKKIMRSARDNLLAKKWAEDFQNKAVFNILRTNNNNFDLIQKALDDFLEKKREVFQRFFFLSNDELLEILSAAQTLQNLQPFLRKCFENIVRLQFDASDNVIGMISGEGEVVTLRGYQARGDVEDWLKTLEEQMKYSLKVVMRNSLIKYEQENTQRKQWVLEFPLQVVVTLDSVFWTKITEENYLSLEADGELDDWFDSNVSQLDELTLLIRGDLSDLQRRTLVALVTQDVHFRDIVDTMRNEQVEGIMDFRWQQQLRFYYEDESIHAKQVNAKLMYGYEYLGSTTRLVITPLTDRCWMTITGALGIKLGAAPQGPAGTGKTESCKDLAKALGRYCIVFNCSDQITVKMMEKLFTGLAFCGAWVCLDEFNRIYIEVLSVIAQQVQTIREALLEQKAQFTFFGKQVNLNPNLGIFITMNPGYAGRTELPDNLKVLFRPVAMMVPDYRLIAEIMLFAEGFSNAKDLSRKMTKLYKLSSEQLSQQDHYDFGMRAVKSLLVMAGSLKRQEATLNEDIVLVRAMRESNIPKFLSHDIPLFNAIVQDLFPGLVLPIMEQRELGDVITGEIEELSLVACGNFVEKVIQLNETLKVRFGVMLVGTTLGGKSQCINVLRQSYIKLYEKYKTERGITNHPIYQPIEQQILNPKAISMDELYGSFDQMTQQWTDGLVSNILRSYSALDSLDKKWVVFDGPVDALWIENMNTVLDDSMTLCLSNGERVKLKPQMRMLFEVLDLAVASPATVSRCGMVYLDEHVVGYQAIVSKECATELKYYLAEDILQYLQTLIQQSFRKAISNLKKKTNQLIQVGDVQLALSIVRIVKMIIVHYNESLKTTLKDELTKKHLEKIYLWSFGWALGSTLTSDSQDAFEKVMSETFPADSLPRGSVFDYVLLVTKIEGKVEVEYLPWEEQIEEFVYTKNMSYFAMVVQTKETVSYGWFLQRVVESNFPLLITGVTGTGKSIMINSTLDKLKDEGLVSILGMTLSAKSSSYAAQVQIEQRLQTQRKNRRTILMPPPGKKFVLFVDDINMPATEVYGAQPPIELLRQLADYKGVYDRKTFLWKDVENTILICACGPPGGGRSHITPRFTRHFNLMCLPTSSEETLSRIFSTIVRKFLKVNGFRAEIIELGDNNTLVNATLSIYTEIQRVLLPTPDKSHYVFNLRDVSKVFQGLLQAKNVIHVRVEQVVRLWTHEICRVFMDRLINHQDQSWFREQLVRSISNYFKFDYNQEELFDHKPPLIFADFMRRGLALEERIYDEVKDYNLLIKVIGDYMGEDTKLNLVLFKDAVEHLSRVARVLRLERGHYMLVGVGGSGKKSLTTLACALAGCQLDTLEQKKIYGKKEFKEDLFRIMCRVGIDNQNIAFSFTDTQITQEGFLEDVNNLLNSGEVPNMLTKEDLEIINNALAQQARDHKVNDVYAFFLHRVRSNLHIVLAMSPIGGQLRLRLRMFPSLVNCCTIEWLQKWPQEALQIVATMFLEKLEYEGITPELRQSLCDLCVYVHQTVESTCPLFWGALKRNVYVTPKSYLDLIESYKELLAMKKEELHSSKVKLSSGLHKLHEANSIIADLKSKLTDLQPILKQKTIEQDALIKKLEVDSYEANKVKVVVLEEEKLVNDKAGKIKEMKAEADKILDAALPTLQAATEALNTLNRNDISEIKGNNNPHAIVKFTLECVSILFEEKSDPDSIKKILADPNFLSRMKNLNVYTMQAKTQAKIKAKIATNPLFVPAEIQKINLACKSMCEWVRAVSEFTEVNKDIVTKKSQVESMNVELDKANQILQVKQGELHVVIKKVNDLEALYNDNKQEKDRLDKDIRTTEERLVRAEELTVGLADEQERWRETVLTLGEEIKLLLGDVFLAGATISYLGPFTGPFRQSLVAGWLLKAEELAIPHSARYSFESVLGDAVKIQHWASRGLPVDSVSTANGIIQEYSRSFPMFIDPQTQANKWIKAMYAEAGLKVIKVSQDGLLKNVENAVRSGLPLLIEDSGDTLEPILEPLLLKQFTIMNRRKLLKLGDSDVEYDPAFRLFLSTKLANPNFLPDVFIRVNVINFTVTELGLEEQLLGDVVSREMPDVEATKQTLIQQIAKGKLNLKRNEERILDLLANSKGMILDNVDLIENLKLSKLDATHVKLSLNESEQKSIEIEVARSKYQPVALRGSILYFVIADFALVDPMYQFSLNYFKRLFRSVIEQSERSTNLEVRLQTLLTSITETIYVNVCRGLFNAHKRIFSFLMTLHIQLNYGDVTPGEWQMFLRGPKLSKQATPVPKGLKLSDKQWNHILQLSAVHANFSDLPQNLQRNPKEWQEYVAAENPWLVELPEMQDTVTAFQRLMLVQTLREEETLYSMTYYVDSILGKRFTSNIPPSIEEIYNDTDHKTPLIFILSAGADPLSNLLRFAQTRKITSDKMTIISLGQGQAIVAERAIEAGIKSGGWVILQNCHLGRSFMSQLEKRIESFEEPELQATFNTQFRLILTSMPCDYFPVSVLQTGIKLTTEPPKGLKSNMYKSYSEMPPEYFEGCDKPNVWKKLLFSLSFFHGVVQERRKFGALGWNIRYEFNDSDFETSYTLLRNFLDLPQEVPWDALNYVIGEITYGGRVTDDFDRRCLLTILSKFINEDVLNDNYPFSESGTYSQPAEGGIATYQAVVDLFPDFEKPEVFGMNDNANITFKLNESKLALDTILSIQPKDAVQSANSKEVPKSQDQIVEELCDILQGQLPLPIKESSADAPAVKAVKDAPPKVPLNKRQSQQTAIIEIDSLKVCVMQEVQRFNRLLHCVQSSIINLKKAIKGEVVMSSELDSIYQSLLNNQVPLFWSSKAYLSLKPLSSFFQDLVLRVSFFKSWFEMTQGQYPKSYWISAFFFPQGFLTSVLQTFARKNKIPIDILGFSFKFLNLMDPEQINAPPDNGAYIYGVFVEGARIEAQKTTLEDSLPGITVSQVPIIHFIPVENYKPDPTQYSMPLYKTNNRAGTLSTTGESTNFVIAVECPTKKSPDYWTLNGAAFITQTND